ncbi:MAG: glycosyltransferase [Chloroflexota bacterium]|nr:glycosyltransferase [Chloroflexota bacterium]
MNILLSTLGSRGDVQPFVALGSGLKAAGHNVAVCTVEGFKPFVEEHGLHYAYVNNALYELMQAKEGRAVLEDRRQALALIKQIRPTFERIVQDEWQAAQAFQPDVMVYHPKSLGTMHIAEKRNIPAFMALPLPFYTPTRAFPHPLFSGLRLGGWFNRFTYRLMALATAPYAGMINDFRVRTLGLPSRRRFASPVVKTGGEPVPILYPYSRHVVPVPADFPPHVHVTGYWFLDRTEDWQPHPELLRFLEAGAPPVYVGFGSMSGTEGEKRARVVLEALARSGQRGILASGWGGLTAVDVPDNVLVIDAAPHDWLFPRVAAVIHHGGAGTTAAGLRAGKPTVICPFIADQPFWGRVVHRLGVGPQPIPQKKLTADRLAAAITLAVSDTAMRRRAADLGAKIRAEDGIARAVAIIGGSVAASAPS